MHWRLCRAVNFLGNNIGIDGMQPYSKTFVDTEIDAVLVYIFL